MVVKIEKKHYLVNRFIGSLETLNKPSSRCRLEPVSMEHHHLILVLLLLAASSSQLLSIQDNDRDYSLIYSIPHAYPDSGWIDSKALYMKEDLDSLFFYVEFYGPMSTTSRDWRRQVSILIDSDKDSATGQHYKEVGVDYLIQALITGDNSVSQALLLRWDERSGDFQNIKDLRSTSTLRPDADHVEIKVDKNDIGYSPSGVRFYVVTTGEWGHWGAPWLDEFSYIMNSNSRHIKVDGRTDDWDEVKPVKTIDQLPGSPKEFLSSRIYVANDEEYIYMRLDTLERPKTAIEYGGVFRYLNFFIDLDGKDDTGDRRYGGAELYMEAEFHSNPSKLNNASYYIYAGENSEWYKRWRLVLRSSNSSDFNDVFELKIPLKYLKTKPQQAIGIFIPWGLVQVLKREIPEKNALSYPPVASTESSTTRIQSTLTTESKTISSTTETISTPTCQAADLEIKPGRIKVGEIATISVSIKNTGNTPSLCSVVLRVDGVIADTRRQVIEPGWSSRIYFSFAPEKEGIYNIDVNGLTGSLEVVKEAEKLESPPTSFPLLITVVIAVAIVALSLLSLSLYRKRRMPPPPPP
jgi:hypothetical protein